MGLTITAKGLQDTLAGLPPLEFEATKLLHARRLPGQLMPNIKDISIAELDYVVDELTYYNERCRDTRHALENLAPIPLTEISILDYGL